MFITFEGPEGCGKTTQVSHLVERLLSVGYDVVRLREPGGTPLGEALRNIVQHDLVGSDISPRAETLLFEASRAQLVYEVINPAIERGAIVVCDRFIDSTLAYQGYGRHFKLDTISALNAFAIDNVYPTLTFMLELNTEDGFERISRNRPDGAPLDRMEREGLEFHKRVNDGYRQLAQHTDRNRMVIIDASQTIPTIHTLIWERVMEELIFDHNLPCSRPITIEAPLPQGFTHIRK